MKTRINKKNETVTITVNHKELTFMWIALGMDSYRYKDEELYESSQICGDLSRELLKISMQLSDYTGRKDS